MIKEQKLQDIIFRENKEYKRLSTKYHIFSVIIEYMAYRHYLYGHDTISLKDLDDFLSIKTTLDYEESACAVSDLWIYEMIWIGLLKPTLEGNKIVNLTITEKGLDSFCKQEYQNLACTSYQTKIMFRLTYISLAIALVAFLVSLISLVYD